MGLTTPPYKTNYVTETTTIETTTRGPIADLSQPGSMTTPAERLVDFCLNNNYVIGGTIFAHRDIHKLTWKSPDGRTSNQIDHIIINGKWRRSLQDVRVCHGADIYSDHYLVTARVKLKLQKVVPESQRRKQLDVTRLACPTTKQEFVLELRNRFSALTDTSEDNHQ